MATKSAINKNNRRKKMAKQYAGKRASLNEIVKNKTLSIEERFAATLKLAKLPRNSNPTRIRNRCALTGRPRATYRKFGMSRMMFRKLASEGLIPGITKSSW